MSNFCPLKINKCAINECKYHLFLYLIYFHIHFCISIFILVFSLLQVFTVEEMMPHLQEVSGAVTKNLFLKDKKKKSLWLVSTRHDRQVYFSLSLYSIFIEP